MGDGHFGRQHFKTQKLILGRDQRGSEPRILGQMGWCGSGTVGMTQKRWPGMVDDGDGLAGYRQAGGR